MTPKWVTVWSNPFLPSALQFPRAFLLVGPVTWTLKMALFLQLWREHFPLLTWPDDPLDWNQWVNPPNLSQWHMVVKPESFLTAMESGVVWDVLISRFTNWHDMAHVKLEDAELSVRCDRYLTGDPQPWPGAPELRNGCLVIDIVDKSGVYLGTSHGGNIFDGLVRTVVEFADDFVDSTLDVIADAETPGDYFLPGLRYTAKEKPYVVFRQGDTSPIQTSQWINSPAKGIQVITGGHSMPGVNESISATIQATFDILGNLFMLGSLGGSVDTLLRPLYEDTILAWWAIKHFSRAQHSGWERYFEYFQDAGQNGASKAYTIASLMVLRAGFWATRTVISWKVQVTDGLPFLIGDRGIGHFFLDDRVGLVLEGDDQIVMDRCRKIDLAWDPDKPPEWAISIGDDRIWEDPAQRAFGKIEQLVAGLRDMGVW